MNQYLEAHDTAVGQVIGNGRTTTGLEWYLHGESCCTDTDTTRADLAVVTVSRSLVTVLVGANVNLTSTTALGSLWQRRCIR